MQCYFESIFVTEISLGAFPIDLVFNLQRTTKITIFKILLMSGNKTISEQGMKLWEKISDAFLFFGVLNFVNLLREST